MSDSPKMKAEALFGRTPARGCWLGIPSIMSAEILGRAGFEFAIVDLEHGPASIETGMAQLIALAGTGTAPVVRVPEGAGPWIKRALDIGAGGIIVPAVETVEEAQAHVRAFRYGPEGRRGNAARIVRGADYGSDGGYVGRWNATGLLICQIESPEALERAEAIAAVDGVDGLFFGPSDYTAAAGFPEPEAVKAAFERIRAAAEGAGKLTGSVPFADLSAADLVADGVEIVAAASDVSILRNGAAAVLAGTQGGF